MNTQNYKYIVVEDEHLIRKNLIKKIESLNLPFTLAGEASNGLDARNLIEKNCPNLVITDIRMPQYDGLELAKYLNKNHPHIKVIILSGYDDFSYAQSAIKFQVKDYLLKPVTLETLSESLTKVLTSMQSETGQLHALRTDSGRLDQKNICELLEKTLKNTIQKIFPSERWLKNSDLPRNIWERFSKSIQAKLLLSILYAYE